MERQEELLAGGGRQVGDGRAEGLSAIGDGEQAAVSLTTDIDGTGPGSVGTRCTFTSLKVCNLKVQV